MGFNLTTFLAQLVNLFLLIWVLKRFLYRPVLETIEKRKQHIAQSIHEADEKLADVSALEKTLTKQQQDFDKQCQKKWENLEQEITDQKKAFEKELVQTRIEKRQQAQEELNQLWETAQDSIQEMIKKQFMILSQKVLKEWLDQSPMDTTLKLFEAKVKQLSQQQKKEIQHLLERQQIIQVITATPLNKNQQEYVKEIVNAHWILNSKNRFRFQHHPDLILGMEIRIDGFVLDWTLNSYLEEINQTLKQQVSTLIASEQQKRD